MECVEVVEIITNIDTTMGLVTTKKSDKLGICTSINKKLVGLYVSGLNVARSWSSQIFISDSVPKMITMMHSFQVKLLEAEKKRFVDGFVQNYFKTNIGKYL